MNDLRSLFEKNAAEFARQHDLMGTTDVNAIWSALSAAEIEALNEGVSDARWTYEGKLIHSQRDAEREAGRAAQTFQNAAAVIAVSVGAGYIFGHFSRAVRSVLLIEPSIYCAAAFLIAGRFVRFTGKITMFVNPLDRSDALEEILPWLQGKNLHSTFIYCHPALVAANKALYTRAYERVVALFEKRSVNQATVVKFQQLWNKNIFLNQRIIWRSGSLHELLDMTPPGAVVLAGAGPSLSESFGDLRSNRSKFILFAADTAVIPLNKAGIYPDFAFSADPQWVNHYFAQTRDAARSVWVLDPVVCPAIPHFLEQHGARMLFWNNAFLADTYFRSHDRGDVAHGGSVSTNAFDVALSWLKRRSVTEKPGKLILVGQDLSFSNKQAHCTGAALEARLYAHCNRLAGMERHNFRQMTAMPVLLEKGIRTEIVRTNGKLKIFLDWFSGKAADNAGGAIELVNATADGARIRGFRQSSLADALHTDQQTTMNDRAFGQAATTKHHSEKLTRLVADLFLLGKIAAENAGLARQKSTAAGGTDRLNKNDEKIRRLSVAKEIAGLNAQAMILRITEQGADVEAAEFYSALAKAAREVRHWAGKNLRSA